MPFKAHELRDRAESLLRMAREATVEREREALGRRAAENLVSMGHGAPTLQSGS
jgi:ribosomal protein L17